MPRKRGKFEGRVVDDPEVRQAVTGLLGVDLAQQNELKLSKLHLDFFRHCERQERVVKELSQQVTSLSQQVVCLSKWCKSLDVALERVRGGSKE